MLAAAAAQGISDPRVQLFLAALLALFALVLGVVLASARQIDDARRAEGGAGRRRPSDDPPPQTRVRDVVELDDLELYR